jgi:hypothetical protein
LTGANDDLGVSPTVLEGRWTVVPAATGPESAVYVMVSGNGTLAKVGALEKAENAWQRLGQVRSKQRSRGQDDDVRLVFVAELRGLRLGGHADDAWLARWEELAHNEAALRLALARRLGRLHGWPDWICVDEPLSDAGWHAEVRTAWDDVQRREPRATAIFKRSSPEQRRGRGWIVNAAAPDAVEAWSAVRLPFGGKPGTDSFRVALHESVSALAERAGPGWELDATYTSDVLDFVDTENVLLYNVGVGAFGSPARIRFQRSHAPAPPPPGPEDVPARTRHHHRYLSRIDESNRLWGPGEAVATWATAVESGAALSSASRVWVAVSNTLRTLATAEEGAALGVEVTVTAPETAAISLAGRLKFLLDGAISACHEYVGDDHSILAGRIGLRTGDDPDTIEAYMRGSPRALGPRPVVARYGTEVKWDPADDRVVFADVRLVRGDGWSISGSIHLASPSA